jgi:hypothetical protein
MTTFLWNIENDTPFFTKNQSIGEEPDKKQALKPPTH